MNGDLINSYAIVEYGKNYLLPEVTFRYEDKIASVAIFQ